MKLMRVRAGRALHWPSRMGRESFRGGPGYVVDLDAPCEAEWCDGMLHVLEPAPKEVTAATPIDSPQAKAEQRKKLEAEKAGANAPKPAAPAGKSVQGDLPTVDMPKKAAAKA